MVPVTLGILISAVFLAVFVIDWIYLRRSHRRAILLEVAGFSVILLVTVRADWFTRIAASLGIGRGVDLLIYPMLVWLFREAVLGRVRYFRQQTEITGLVRRQAVDSARVTPRS